MDNLKLMLKKLCLQNKIPLKTFNTVFKDIKSLIEKIEGHNGPRSLYNFNGRKIFRESYGPRKLKLMIYQSKRFFPSESQGNQSEQL